MIRPKLFIFIFIINLTHSAFAIVYECPKTPITISLGETIKGDWFVWGLGDKQTALKKYYYKLIKKEYTFKYWVSYPSGNSIVEQSKNNKFIACCGWQQSEKKNICVFKYVKFKKCKPILKRNPTVKFVCEDGS
jgi:hypothetical protein